MALKQAKKFDERQLHIRGQVFFHGFLVFAALNLLCAMLASAGVAWGDGFAQHMLVLLASVAVASVEAIVRDAYFGAHGATAVFAVGFFALTLVSLAWNVADALRGAPLAAAGMLTDAGCMLAIAALLFAIGAAGFAKWLAGRRER